MTSRAREVPALISHAILEHVTRALGEGAAAAVRTGAGEARTHAELAAHGAWSSVATTVAIAEGAARCTGDAEVARRGGEELFRNHAEIGMTDFLLTEGTVLAALERVVAISGTISLDRQVRIIDVADRAVLIESVSDAASPMVPLLCAFSGGYWAGVPAIFGASGYRSEAACQALGDDRCLTRIAWTAPHGEVDCDAAGDRVHSMVRRIEELQASASDLAAAKDVTTVLELIVDRAGTAVLAPRFLLAVRLEEQGEVRVHHRGFADETTAGLAGRAALAGELPGSPLSIDIASARRHFGKIVAFFPEGAEPSRENRLVLSAYAGHAAAALETAAALEDAQRDRDTARSLLALAQGLNVGSDPRQVAARLAKVLPPVVGAARAAVWLSSPSHSQLQLAASSSRAAGLPDVLTDRSVPALEEIAATGRPVLLAPEHVTPPLRAFVGVEGHAAVMPLIARGTRLGLVLSVFGKAVPAEERALVLERLTGCADIASTALDNSHLVEEIRHQAEHDALTGLPNRALLEVRGDIALEAASRTGREVGILFVDLDHFKDVNDTFGHHAGDDLIRETAVRIRSALRPSDTLARTGGDEFVVLLSEVDRATAVEIAARIVEVMQVTFVVQGHRLDITCSVGVAVAAGGSGSYESLVQYADRAMYEAKRNGRNTSAVDPASRPAPESLSAPLREAADRGSPSPVLTPGS